MTKSITTTTSTTLSVIAVLLFVLALSSTASGFGFRSSLLNDFFHNDPFFKRPLHFRPLSTPKQSPPRTPVRTSTSIDTNIVTAPYSYKYLPESEQTVVLVELPGVKRENVKVEIGEDRLLTVTATTSYCPSPPVTDSPTSTPGIDTDVRDSGRITITEEDDDGNIVAVDGEGSEGVSEKVSMRDDCPFRDLEKTLVTSFKVRTFDVDKIWSELENGILFIYVPKPSPQTRAIPVLRGGYVNVIDREVSE
jgi:HSP20 family molecular chaperone IbpA